MASAKRLYQNLERPPAPPRDLLSTPEVSLINCNHARVFQDPRSKALTMTFDYFAGEPDVRLPVRPLGRPTDWSNYRSLQYTFQTLLKP